LAGRFLRVLAARFPDRQRAAKALRALRVHFGLAEDDADIAPLGTPGRGDEGEQTLLAGRFDDAQTEFVRTVVADSGGHVVADVDEQWTRPRAQITAVELNGHVRDGRSRLAQRSRAVRQSLAQ
jgi:hypothetical protein